jgi:hypothetical protein
MPTLMPTRAVLGELTVSPERTKLAYLWSFADFTILGGPYNSQLVMRIGQRFESACRLFRDPWEDKTQREIVLKSVRRGRPQPI